ncbi:Coenzyme F420 hydrogenase/dehydrogenase, beta subunit C-terminal domain [Candidatus Sumerlaeota bacterium]|nr:Coenzyme F420 hydrogenase/dehydrogenase, beta subunit C-terminal domain [Candidatus Sumerlaeota bacterium]
MTDALRIKHSPDEALRALLAFLLESGRVSAVLSLERIGRESDPVQSLITDPEALDSATPLLPMMPSNAGKLLAEITELNPTPEPIAAVLRPCELRALVELRKLNRAHLENTLLISFTCGGVFPLSTRGGNGIDARTAQWRDALSRGENADGIRPTCRACEHFVPSGADLTVALVGESAGNGTCTILIDSERGAEALEGFEGERTEVEPESEALRALQARRAQGADDLFSDPDTADLGLDGLIRIFGRCLSCRACSTVCPICYCDLCYFDSSTAESNPTRIEAQLRHRRAVRIPTDTVRFHIGRMMHMAISCVGCGMCSDVCPVSIPVATLFSMVGRSAGDVFSYVPGRDLTEALPLTRFEAEELTHIGEERSER